MKKLLVILSLILVLAAILSLTVFAQAENEENPCQGCEICNPTSTEVNDEMPPMKVRIDGEAFLHSLGLMGKGMIGIFVVTLVIVGVVAILNWHGKTLEDRKNRNQ